jgi:import inner membrane translocase subunit TIM44
MTDHRFYQNFHSTYTHITVVMKSRPIFLHALKLRQQTIARPAVLRQIAYRPLSTTSRLLNEQSSQQQQQQDGQKSQKEQEKEKARKKRSEEEEVNAPPQSPFKVFAQVLKEEISKNKAWQDNVKQLQGDVDKLADSQAMKRAREVYERARVCPSILLG